MRYHYNVYSQELDQGCVVFNAADREEAKREALNQQLGEKLDRLYDGDSGPGSAYDSGTDLEIRLICDSNTVKAIEDRDI